MSDVFDQSDDAATPLTIAEQRDLIPSHISNRGELNEAEQENILRGQDWALRRRTRDLLNEKFITRLHRTPWRTSEASRIEHAATSCLLRYANNHQKVCERLQSRVLECSAACYQTPGRTIDP